MSHPEAQRRVNHRVGWKERRVLARVVVALLVRAALLVALFRHTVITVGTDFARCLPDIVGILVDVLASRAARA